jgi:hypothetical protein
MEQQVHAELDCYSHLESPSRRESTAKLVKPPPGHDWSGWVEVLQTSIL